MEYPAWICDTCGERLGRKPVGNPYATWHMDTCDVCHDAKAVTDPRDFGGLRDDWRDLIG